MEDNAITCSLCSKIYKNKITYNKHITLNRCSIKVLDNKCQYCNNTFKTKQNKQKHEVRCPENKKVVLDEKIRIVTETLEEIKKITGRDVDIGLICPGSTFGNLINNGTINNVVNNTQNIIINNFGDEDTSHITKKQLIKAFKMCKEFPLEMIKFTHFNKDKPENHNIYKPNFKDKYVKYFNDSVWKMGDANKIITELYMSKMDIAEEKFEDLKVYLSEITKDRFQWFLDNREETEVMREIIKKIAEMMYNEKDVVIETIK